MHSSRLVAMRALFAALCFACAYCGSSSQAWGRGVSPYLPLGQSQRIERAFERVLILADKPLMRRPIPAAVVLDALPRACELDAVLCAEVRAYLARFERESGITQLQVGVAGSTGARDKVVPDAHGMEVGSNWLVSAGGFFQPYDYALVSAGAIAYDGRATPTGSALSLGFDFAQLDIGYRDHWLSPQSDGSPLIGTEAATMPSVTLSNYAPLTRLGLNYEVFLAQMSQQDGIRFFGGTTAGNPRLAGLQLGMQPASGYGLAINRLFQYGGGARSSTTSDFFDALFKNHNLPDVTGQSEEFGNQVASLTSSMVFPGKTPFKVNIEYAGEDNSFKGPYRLGATYLSLGLDFPKLWQRYDLGFEIAEWQQQWYVHHIYPLGLTNYGKVIGSWFGDSRVFGDAYYGNSQSLRMGMHFDSGAYLNVRYRRQVNTPHDDQVQKLLGLIPFVYKPLQEIELDYATSWHGHDVDAQLYAGTDVFGKSYTRIGASVDLVSNRTARPDYAESAPAASDVTDLFIDAGVNYSHVYNRIAYQIPDAWTDYRLDYHYAVGARRKISTRNDLGLRLEFDRLDGHSLISLRAVDYRFRWSEHFATGAFFGASRYLVGLAADGYYWGGGVQWMNLMKGWDLGLDVRHNDKLTRTKLLRSDPYPDDLHGFYFDTNGVTLYLSRRF
jgi:hypothetical protein